MKLIITLLDLAAHCASASQSRWRRGVLMAVCVNLYAGIANAAPDFAELYAAHSSSVVTVFTRSADGSTGLGSGVLIEQGRILTAAHVVADATRLQIQFKDESRSPAVILSVLESSDIALLQLPDVPTQAAPAVLADSDATRIGEPVFIIGSPFGITQTLSIGHLSGRMNRGLLAAGAPIEFLQTDTAINTGNSGGPMFNIRGEVIGIVSFILTKSGGFDGIGFATSSNTAREALLNSAGLLAGFEGLILDESMAALLNLPDAGLLVQRVVPGSVAAKAGLRAGSVPAQIGDTKLRLGGDVILEINGLVCRSPHDYQALRTGSQALNPEDSYSLKIFREGETLELFAGADVGSSLLQQVAPATAHD